LTSQTRRAGFSVVANIAEGSAKRGGREFARYLDIALGSLTEIEVALRLARDRGYVTNERWAELERLRNHAGILTWRLYRALRNRRSEEHTSELQSRGHLVCRLLLEKKKKKIQTNTQSLGSTHLH